MKGISKKYVEDFEQLVRHFEKLKLSPNSGNLQKVMEDLHQMHTDLENLNF